MRLWDILEISTLAETYIQVYLCLHTSQNSWNTWTELLPAEGTVRGLLGTCKGLFIHIWAVYIEITVVRDMQCWFSLYITISRSHVPKIQAPSPDICLPGVQQVPAYMNQYQRSGYIHTETNQNSMHADTHDPWVVSYTNTWLMINDAYHLWL